MKQLLSLATFLVLSLTAFANLRTPKQAAQLAAEVLNNNAVSGPRRTPAQADQMQLVLTLNKQTLDLEVADGSRQPASARKNKISRRANDSAQEADRQPRQTVHIEHGDNEPALYVFNTANNDGFAVISADTRTVDILCYSDEGPVDTENMAPAFRWWLDRFVEEISSLTDEDDEQMASPRRSPQTITPIEPLLGGIVWGQNTPFNNNCPIDTYDNTRCVTGCVATAAAQIMRYWKWPVTGTGSHSYQWTNQLNSTKKTLSLNFASITFDWDNMLPSYNGDYTTVQANAVARLMYACGVSVDMGYGGNSTAGSGAVTDNMATALTTYFGYQYVGNLGSSYNNINNNSIYSGSTTYAQAYSEYFNDDLENGRPILMSGTSAGGGHAFVCDGRDADGYFHINWGWTGASNCYTPLTAIRPGYPKHNDLYFSTRMYATYGLRPNTTCANTTNHTTISETEDNLPYFWRGQEITATGIYEDTETDGETGCTTTYMLHFTARPSGTDGMCGDNLFYAYNTSTHTLTITGTGDMWEYDFLSTPGRKTPWYPYASDITTIILSEGMTSMSAFAFVYCSSLTSITIPSTITSIGTQPFFGCTSLQSIVWNAVDCVQASARNLAPFYDVRSQITSFTFGENVETIPGALCYGMSGITSCTLPGSLVNINIWAFSGCSGLTEITLPGNVEYLGRQSFQNCTGLTSITIPENVELMADSVFCGCTNLTSVVWNAKACAINGTSTKYYPFYYIRTLITSFTFGSAVTSLPQGCCRSLTGLTEITIPAGLTSIPARCFQDCSSLATLTFESDTPPAFGNYAFNNVPNNAVVYVPCGTIATYSASTLPFSDYRSSSDEFFFAVDLVAQEEGTGEVSVSTAFDCTTNQGVITATPAEHYHFVRWTDEDANAENVGAVRNVTVTANASYTAIFEEDPKYTISVSSINDDYGTVAVNAAEYYEDDVAEITISPAEHYHFDSWSGEGSGDITHVSGNTYQYTVGTQNRTFTATFAEDTKYTLTLYNDGHGTASADKASYYAGETATITITPNEHYHFSAWSGTDSENINGSGNTFTYTIGTENREFTVTFAEDSKYTLTLNNDGHGTASADKALYYAGETATITVTPAEHYHFSAWSGTDSENISGSENIFTYTFGTESRVFTAAFAADNIGGYCEKNGGTNLTWQFSPDNGTLTITGTGDMEDYTDMPWESYSSEISHVSLADRADQTPLLTWLNTQTKDITIQRTLYADGCYNTLCLPFNLTAAQVSTFLPHATLCGFTGASVVGGELEIQLHYLSEITAGEPFLVFFPAADADIVNPTFTDVQVTAASGTTLGSGDVRFVGILKPTAMTEGNENQLMMGGNNTLFWSDRNANMYGFRAYFDTSTGISSPIRRGMPARVVMQPSTPTDAEHLGTEETSVVEKRIDNGQLVIIRNGIKYTAQGQLIK